MKLDLDYKKIWSEVITTSLIIIISAVAIISFIVISDQSVDIYNPSNKIAVSVGSDRIEEVLSLLQSKYMGELDVNELTEGAIEGILSKIEDPYTRYLTEEEYLEQTRDSAEEYSGIGIHMSWSLKTGNLRIIGVMPDTPAKKAGLRAGDVIVSVDGVSVTMDNITTISDAIKGEEGTTVKLVVAREGKNIEFSMQRAHIIANNIESNIIDNIGYIRILQFDTDVYEQFKAEYDKLLEKNVKGLIIDLRDNPGGLVNETINIANLLIDNGTILKVMYGDNTVKSYKANSTQCEIPLVVLVNENSASASEILAGAIKDLKQGVVVGTTTFGKGIMQSVIGLEGGGGLSITSAKFYTASGTEIHGVGIEPNIEVELTSGLNLDAVICTSKDNQFNEAVEQINSMLNDL
ncbi:MAG: S41 family peptidase [Clostridia bacterium]|nr:S41 family peptidase [Clostridia bacterium]